MAIHMYVYKIYNTYKYAHNNNTMYVFLRTVHVTVYV